MGYCMFVVEGKLADYRIVVFVMAKVAIAFGSDVEMCVCMRAWLV